MQWWEGAGLCRMKGHVPTHPGSEPRISLVFPDSKLPARRVTRLRPGDTTTPTSSLLTFPSHQSQGRVTGVVSKATLDLSHLVNSRGRAFDIHFRISEQVCKSSESTGQCTSRHMCVRGRERAQVGVFIVLPSEH